MTERVVVCFFFPPFADRDPAEALDRARSLGERATALGGRLVAWSATLRAFDFDPDSIDDAVEFAVSLRTPLDVDPASHRVGVSVGPMQVLDDAALGTPLSWGHPLVIAEELARAAGAGDLLVDAELSAVLRGRLRTLGARSFRAGDVELRALVVDCEDPLLPAAASVVRPQFIGRPEIDELVVPPGAAALLRAGRGFGGSRLLDEVEEKFAPARVLRVAPGALGEPLGALRRAVLTARAPAGTAANFASSLSALLAGEGLDANASADLLCAWIAPTSARAPTSVVVLDDANEIDADTLDVVARAAGIAEFPFRTIIRVGDLDRAPSALAPVTIASEVPLGSLSHEEAALLASRAVNGKLDPRLSSLFAGRGGRLPLGIVESLRDAVESGEVAFENGTAVAHVDPGTPEASRSPKHWIRQRLGRLEPASRRVLEAIAVLGVEAESAEVFDVIRRRSDLGIDARAAVESLERVGFVVHKAPDLVALPSASHRDAILSMDPEGEALAWHAAVADVLAMKNVALLSCRAAVHATLAGDLPRAAREASRAATAAEATGLSATAEAFRIFAERKDADPLLLRRLSRSDAGVAQASERPRASLPPSAVAALRTGDAETVERLANRLRVEDRRADLAERLSAMAKLARGETGDAIRRLRRAADEARRSGSPDRCRAALALGVALAAANRNEQAMLEALDALARARETEDKRGERACIRFLAQLSATAGHPDIAAAWAGLANA